MEKRYSAIEVRTVGDNITGYASVFYNGRKATEYELMPGVVERIMPGAFDGIEEADVVALFNHDPNMVLGRTPNTLRLSVDSRGLRYEITPDLNRTVARDVLSMVRSGDIRGSSFGFFAEKTSWAREKNVDVRQIEKVRLIDISPVTYPAYKGTSVMVRAQQEWEEFTKDRTESDDLKNWIRSIHKR